MSTVLGLAGLLTVAATAGAEANPSEKKLIAVGWDMPNAERLRANLAVMEQTPLNGCSVRFAGPGNSPNLWFSFSRVPYDDKVVGQFLADLKAVRPRQLQDRFLFLSANPGDVDWFDDAGWRVIVDHWRTAARVARAGGLRGIMFDPEPYTKPYWAFKWPLQEHAIKHSFPQYQDKVRERGREIMRAVAGEYPEATIFALALLSVNELAADSADPMSALAGQTYGLLPAFVNGWLDVAPPTLTFVDGCESAYRYNSRLDYLNGAHLIRNKCLRLIAPENQYKYRAQVQVGFGLYLDAYVNPPTSPWYIDPGPQTPVQRLSDNVTTALEVADQYVWLYGERCCWWPTPMGKPYTVRWPEKLPGIDQALRLAVNPPTAAAGVPLSTALELLSKPGERANRVVNGDFTPAAGAKMTSGEPPTSWAFWQLSGVSEGRPLWDPAVGHGAPGAAAMTGVKLGCLFQTVAAAPGERYVVAAWCRVQGHGVPSATIGWQTPEGKWHAEALDLSMSVARTEGEWKLMAGVGTVPEGAGKLAVRLGAYRQQSDQDVIWWDDVTVLPVD